MTDKIARDFFDPTPDQQNVVLIAGATLREGEHMIESCEQCNSEPAEIPFDWILDRVTCSDSTGTDYILEEPAKCPNCRRVTFWLHPNSLSDPVTASSIISSASPATNTFN